MLSSTAKWVRPQQLSATKPLLPGADARGVVLPELFPSAQVEGPRSWWKEVAGGRDDLDIVHGRGVVKHNPCLLRVGVDDDGGKLGDAELVGDKTRA